MKKIRRLLVVCDTYLPKKDGVVIFLQETLAFLMQHYEVSLIVPDFDSDYELPAHNIMRIPLSNRIKSSGYSSVRLSYGTMSAVRRAVKKNDIIFVQDLAFLGLCGIRYGRTFHKPTVAFVHQISWDQLSDIVTKSYRSRKVAASILKLFSRKAYNKCTELMIPAYTIGEKLRGMGVEKPMTLITLGTDIERFVPSDNKEISKRKLGFNENDFILGYCGRISSEKDIATLVSAHSSLRKEFPNCKLLLVGDGDRDLIKESTDNYEGIRITGFVDDVVPYLQAMDVFILPSLTETTSLATIEAMSCGLPVVVTPVGRLKEIIRRGYNGYLFPKSDVEHLIIQLKRLLKNNNLCMEVGRNARETVKEYSWKNSTDKMIRLFSRL